MANKITKVQMLEMIKAEVSANVEMVDFINHEIDLLNRKAENKKATKTQVENVGIKATIVSVLQKASAPMTATEILKADPTLEGLSNQKISALLKQLVEVDCSVVKATEKKVSRFSIAPTIVDWAYPRY